VVDLVSPLQPIWRPGAHGNPANGVGVVLSETQPLSIVQVSAWPGEESAIIAAIKHVTGTPLPDGAGGGSSNGGKAAFGIAPGRFLAVDEEAGLADALVKEIPISIGTVVDLSHGRTAIRVAGPKAEWVLAKFFAVDFSLTALPIGSGVSTRHHDIFAQIQRTGPDRFDLYVFRSFARSFWTALCHGSEEVGYEVR
jgi:methylglutamate dehydrogenase subunit D